MVEYVDTSCGNGESTGRFDELRAPAAACRLQRLFLGYPIVFVIAAAFRKRCNLNIAPPPCHIALQARSTTPSPSSASHAMPAPHATRPPRAPACCGEASCTACQQGGLCAGQPAIAPACPSSAASTHPAEPWPSPTPTPTSPRPFCTPDCSPPGYYSGPGATDCVICPVDQFSPVWGLATRTAGDQKCIYCPSGTVAVTEGGDVGQEGSVRCAPW